MPKPADAEVELFAGAALEVSFQPIAIVDSERYALGNLAPKEGLELEWIQDPDPKPAHDAMREKMFEDLRVLARELGGDAVHKIRLLSTKERGMIPDNVVPLPGAIRQGYHSLYFLRGDVVRYEIEAETPEEE